MADNQLPVLIVQLFRHLTPQQRQQFRTEALPLYREVFKFLGVGHSPDAVMLFHQLVALAHAFRGHLFLWGKTVFNHFKYPIESR
ncbi:hypothetical protein D3C71_1986190 [compost metagenome]